MSAHDTPTPAADRAAMTTAAARGLPLWAKIAIYVAVMLALAVAAQAWLT